MKKIALLLLTTTLIVSCGKNEGEKMLYDYQQNNVKALNFDLADLNFKIQKVEKVADIKASDSLKIIEDMFSGVWDQIDKSLSDAEKFEQLRYIFIGTGAKKNTIAEVEILGKKYNHFAKNPNIFLTTKYRVSYTMNNPLMGNSKQTFDKFYYTNASQTEFIKEESVEGN